MPTLDAAYRTWPKSPFRRALAAGLLAGLFSLFGFPFFGYRIVGRIIRGLVVHIFFWTSNICFLTMALFVTLSPDQIYALQEHSQSAALVHKAPFISFFGGILYCVIDVVLIVIRREAVSSND